MHISIAELHHLLETWGYLVVFLFVAIESTGIPFPGETMLVTASVYAGAGHLQIPVVIAASAAGAIVGDNLGYLIGRTGGRGIVTRYGKYVRLDEAKLDAAERFFNEHGDKTVFFGRFVALLRAWAAFLAGLNRMHWRKFVFFNAAGGICWSVLYGTLAFFLGKNLPLLHRVLSVIGIGGVVIAVVVVVVLAVIYRRRRASHRESRVRDENQRQEAAS